MQQPKKAVKTLIQVSVESSLLNEIKKRAEETDRSVSNYVRTVLKMVHGKMAD